jgi:hypothetical protein
MSQKPLVSFVVPCYNFGHLLSECVNSILSQTFEDFEVLIMDNCSPDDTSEVARSFKDPRVKYIRNESNLGHVRNFNKGLGLAIGKYLWLIAADDFLRSSLILGRYVEEMERSPRVGFAFCRSTELRNGIETGIAPWADCGDKDRLWSQPDLLIRLIESNCIVMSSVMMRRECFETVGPFQLDLPFALDWYMWCTLALHYDAAYFSEPMVVCRFHEKSLTSQYSKEHTRICIADELAVLWRIGEQAAHSGNPALRGTCRSAFALRAFHLLMATLDGSTPSMTADEFEEILRTHIGDANNTEEIRATVYSSLIKPVSTYVFQERAISTAADELKPFWGLKHHAEHAGIGPLAAACDAACIRRLEQLLMAGLHGKSPSLDQHEFDDLLDGEIRDASVAKEFRAAVYTTLADQLYCAHEYAKAAHSYWLGLKARPWRAKTWTKLLLLRTGGIGIRIRQLVS